MKKKLMGGNGDLQAVMLLFFVTMFMGVHLSMAQYFDPNVDDKTYLDNIQSEVQIEVKNTKSELMEEAKIIQGVTRRYIGAKLKENIFKALRILAEKELETISMQERPRQPRLQEEDGGEEEDGGGESAAGGVDATTRRGLIPQLALILKAIFGGNNANNINATRYVESASTYLPKPLGNQLIGVVSLLERNRRQPATVPPAASPVKFNSSEIVIIEETPTTPRRRVYATVTPFVPIPTTRRIEIAQKPVRVVARPGDEDDEDESFKRGRQVQIPGLSILGNIFKGFRSANVNNVTTAAPGTTTESLSGFEEETPQMNKVSMAALVDGIRDQIDDLRQNIPDIFQGAREAYKLLETVSGLFERLGDRNPVSQTL